ncbi:MAG: amidohydrolase [Bacteroidetes bacterium]|nr:amidohydrolase [Bacteroidota bacterium]
MLSIDIHTHILPENIPNWNKKFGYGDFIHLEHHKPCCAKMMKGTQFFREIENNCWSPEKRIEECSTHHVSQQVLSTIPVLFYYWAKPKDGLETAVFLNDHIAEVVSRYPKKFIGLGTVPLQDVDLSIKELERCKKNGLVGVQIGSNVNQQNLSEPHFHRFFEACEALDMCLFIHPWEMMGQQNMQKYWLPWLVGMPAETSRAICSMLLSGVFEKYKKLRVAFAHGGGSFPFTQGRIAHGYDCRPDLVAIDNPIHPNHFKGKFYVDSLVHAPQALDFLIDVMGEDFIALGSDYPFPLGENIPGNLIRQHIHKKELQEKLLANNALKWLNLEATSFL